MAGDVFASPSTAAVARVCRHADQGGGIILGFGNYAGDVLNFGVAAERLRSEGIDVCILPVTDDVASAPVDSSAKRRGIAGDLVVFKIAGAAAEAGKSLDEVERLARYANDRTFSFGVAFGGCTLPGAAGPLFTVPDGQMALPRHPWGAGCQRGADCDGKRSRKAPHRQASRRTSRRRQQGGRRAERARLDQI
ncbi:dihydroxyacetone kinase subunit DhaK [Sinorhizobium medicae]